MASAPKGEAFQVSHTVLNLAGLSLALTQAQYGKIPSGEGGQEGM